MLDNPFAYLFAQDIAETLQIAGAALTEALDELRADSERGPSAGEPAPARRAKLVSTAADRLYAYLVQREALGLSDHRSVFETWEIPQEVLTRIGTGGTSRAP